MSYDDENEGLDVDAISHHIGSAVDTAIRDGDVQEIEDLLDKIRTLRSFTWSLSGRLEEALGDDEPDDEDEEE